MLARILAGTLAALVLVGKCPAQPLTTAMTFQGQLENAGAPASGTYDLRFTLFDSAVGGAQTGPQVCSDNITIANGRFTVQLDFGAQFTGSQRFIEIAARPDTGLNCSSGAGYTTLSPRQNLTAAPNAAYAKTADLLDGLDSTSFVQTTGAQTVAGAKTLSGPTYLNGFVGFGTTSAIGAANFVMSQTTTGYGGMYINTTGATGLPFYGYAQAGGIAAFHFVDGSDGNKWKLVNGGLTALTVTPAGELGIGTGTFTYAATPCRVAALIPATKAFAIFGGTPSGTAPGAGPGHVPALWVDTGSVMRAVEITSTTLGAGATGLLVSSDGSNAAITAFGLGGSLAAQFSGNVIVSGSLAKSGGSFKIDHPLDPANKYLYHSFVESPDMMNIYNGNATTDARGYATVAPPDWFEALNKDFRYQLTVIDDSDSEDFAQAKVVRQIKDRSFTIRTSRPNVQVSWQVTGIRHDVWADAHRIPVEEDKPPHERGLFLTPTEWGQPKEKGVSYHMQPQSPSR